VKRSRPDSSITYLHVQYVTFTNTLTQIPTPWRVFSVNRKSIMRYIFLAETRDERLGRE
jgi:hypothetical protein